MAPGVSQMVSYDSQIVPNGLWWFPNGFYWFPNGPKWFLDGPRWLPKCPRWLNGPNWYRVGAVDLWSCFIKDFCNLSNCIFQIRNIVFMYVCILSSASGKTPDVELYMSFPVWTTYFVCKKLRNILFRTIFSHGCSQNQSAELGIFFKLPLPLS